MPQAVVAALVAIGLSVTAATIVTAAIFIAAGLLLSGGGGGRRAEQSERTVRSPAPARVWITGRRRSYGAQMLFANGANGSTVDVWAYAEGPNNAVIAAYINDDRITVSGGFVQALSDRSYGQNKLQAGWNLGAATETAHAAVTAAFSGWTTAHRGDGICSGYLVKQPVKSEDFLEVFPQGDNTQLSLVIEGVKLFDPRAEGQDPYDPSTWAYDDNAALVHLWFRLVIIGDDYDEVIAPHENLWIAAANECDVAMTLSAGGTEPKYRAWVMFDLSADPSEIEEEIRKTYDGWTAFDGNGALKVYAGKLYAPTVSVGPAQIIDYSLSDGVQTEERTNQIILRHISADHDYLEVEPEAWRDEADITARGKELTSPLAVQVPSHTQARRLAKRAMSKINAAQRGMVRVKHSAREALAERFIALTIEEAGYVFFTGTVEVVGGEFDPETGGAVIEWISTEAAVDLWVPAAEDGQPAPVEGKVYVTPPTLPTIDDAVGELDGGSSARIALSFTLPSGAGSTWFTRWRVAGDSSWTVETHSDVTASGTLLTGSVPLNASIEAAIAYTGAGGIFSGWSTTETISTLEADLAPSANTMLTITGGSGSISGGWTNSTAVNFGHSELWYHTSDDLTAASQLGSDYAGAAGVAESVSETVSAGTYFFWSLAFNAAGTERSVAGPVSATVS